MSSRALAVVAVLLVASFGCGDLDGSAELTQSARRAPRKSMTDGEIVEDHDETKTPGATNVDPGNPNADTPPPAPTTQGTAAAEFALTLASATPTVNLGESVELDVTVEPKGG